MLNSITPAGRCALIAVLCVVALLLSADSTVMRYLMFRVYAVVVAVMPGLLVALACAGLGDLLVRRARDLSLPERFVLAFACGLGLMSVPVAAAGFTGSLNQLTAYAMAGAGLVCGIPLWKRLAAALAVHPVRRVPLSWWNWRSTVLLVVLLYQASLMLGIALTPPAFFDVTEYHLGPYRDYASAGGNVLFTAQPHNFYARFPFPIEAVYYLGLTLAPYVDAAPKLLNMFCVLACGALGGMLAWRWTAQLNVALLAALVTFGLPVMLDVSIDALIDAPVSLLVISSFYLLARWKDTRASGAATHLAGLAAVVFGAALCSKYTVAQLYLLPWLLVAAPALGVSLKSRPLPVLGYLVLACVAPVVWFGKNVALYGNPLEPFFHGWFQPENALAIAREKFYIESHFPQSPLSADYWASLLPRLHEFTWLYLVACTGWFFRADARRLIQVAMFVVPAYLLWNLVRESQDRFLLPCLVLVAVCGVIGLGSLPSRVARYCAALTALVLCGTILFQHSLRLRTAGMVPYLLDFSPTREAAPTLADDAPGAWEGFYELAPEGEDADEPSAREQYYVNILGALGEAISRWNRVAPADARLLLIYEARPYLFSGATAYNTVWDDSVLLDIVRNTTTVQQALAALRQAGYTHVLVNKEELLRYIQQYARPRQLVGLGVPPGSDPRAAWELTLRPQNLYPPFYRDKDWEQKSDLIADLLEHFERTAIIREATVESPPDSVLIDVIISPTI